ncbi:MAG: MinD/ParA family protein [Anaerovibrio sp.]|uniref:MinD/ParA family protein n=1 Tax=Anaerovibrio sp. TaxID=1872532 RepID=UPI0025D3AB38|nr:MinD/ParA family protein [Anaerovibrio sp.]MCR5175923.1 MinD/ParA family protein [Anaerovibrio sp.]
MDDQAARLRLLVGDKKPGSGVTKLGKSVSDQNGQQEEHFSPRTIAITSGKGGVGKTNLTVNLAIALGNMGKRVIVIDADMGMANVDILLGTTSRVNLMSLLDPDVELENVLLRGPYGVSYISGGSGMEHAMEMTVAEREILFRKLAGCEEWADIILIDTGAGIGNNVLDFLASADEVLLITTPEPTALTDAYAVMKGYSNITANPNLKLIVNRVIDEPEIREVVGTLSRTAARFLKLPVECLGYIYDDKLMIKSVRQQVPIMAGYPDAISAKCISSIASGLVNGRQEKVKLGWRGFLKKIFKS